MSVYAHAIPQVAPPLVGVHLLWNGPHTWVYSPRGWTVQRRLGSRREPPDCLTLTPEQLATLRARHELQIRFGILTQRIDVAPIPLVTAGSPDGVGQPASATQPSPTCEVIVLELDTPQARVRVTTQAAFSMAVALRDGKTVAGGTPRTGLAAEDLVAQGIDTVVLFARGLSTLMYCQVRATDDDWTGAKTLGKFQIPIRELMPELTTPDAEFALASSRLLPGETLDRGEFEGLTEILRQVVRTDGPPRPIDLALLIKEDADAQVDELVALDPIASLLPHPKWRRILGFGHFDRDPELVQGETYQYRVIGGWPGVDLVDRVYGFHTTPAATPIPREIYINDLRLRLPNPAMVELHDLGGLGEPGARITVTRRGIRLSPERLPFWMGPDLEGWSAVIDFPSPISSVILELADADQSLTFAVGAPWLPPGATQTVPPGNRPRLDLAAPIHQLRLNGKAFLCGFRVPQTPAPPAIVEQAAVLPAIVFADAPLPLAPLAALIANLQQPHTPPPVIDASAPPATKHALGFEVRWTPAPAAGIVVWPPSLPPPPSEATLFQVEHSPGGSAPTAWTPLLTEENFMTGHRETGAAPPALAIGGDLMQSFPEIRQPEAGNVTVLWQDVFDFEDGGLPVRRPLPPPGTFHKYRIRAIDPAGRPSATWRETAELRLEKWVPPPLPAGPDQTKADQLTQPKVTGVHARVLVRDAPDLTAPERALLGSHSNAVILHWGWHESHRAQDPFATEFRVYSTRRRLDAIPCTLDNVTTVADGMYHATIVPDEDIAADTAAKLRLHAGYPFEVLSHAAATAHTPAAITLVARVSYGGVFPVPIAGPVLLPIRLTTDRTRATAWAPRREIVPITTAVVYESAPMFDLLDLQPDHPSDEMFVGLSVSDAQAYVPDQLGAGRPGNESAISAVPIQGRWLGRPVVVDAPAIADVPVLVTPEPADRPMTFDLDLGSLLTDSGFADGDRVLPERVAADEVFRAYRVDAGRVIGRVLEPRRPSDVEHDVVIPNANDRAAILSALGASDVAALADRYVVFLAASHPHKARLFRTMLERPVALTHFTETIPNRGARYVYRLRRTDASGHLSDDGFTLRGIVRVPATTRVPPPRRETAAPDDPPQRLRLRIDGSEEVRHLLLFRRSVAAGERVDVTVDLLRVPNAARLAPGDAVRLRLGDGTLIAPEVKSLSDPDVTGTAPIRRVTIDVPIGLGEKARIWTVALTQDNVSSDLAGAWTIATPLPPLAAPTLSVTASGTELAFSWTWPTPADAVDAILETAALDSHVWSRISPRLARDVAAFTSPSAGAGRRYRLRALTIDGRVAYSNDLTP